MNLTSCNHCGVVLDKNKLKFPEDYCDDKGDLIDTLCVWAGREWTAFVTCPVCKNKITENGYDPD